MTTKNVPHGELLASADLPAACTLASPWSLGNIVVTGLGEASGGERHVTLTLQAAERNGHLVQTYTAPEHGGRGSYILEAEVRVSGAKQVALNGYAYFGAEEDDKKVYQSEHPGDGSWHALAVTIPSDNRPVARVQAVLVLRSGAGEADVRNVSLRFELEVAKPPPEGPSHFNVSHAYFDAIVAMVDHLHASSDEAYRTKLLRYHIGTNRKGMRVVGEITDRLALADFELRGNRFLDLGSGMGGSLIGAAEHGAAYCEGWEIKEEKLELSQLNVQTLYEDSDRITIRRQSLEEPESLGPDFEPFHLVFCQEVFEHVKDIGKSVDTLARCTDPQAGVAYVSVPNGYSLQNVLEDPHLNIFGIDLLDRFEAQPITTAIKNHTLYSEMMGDYYRFDEYVGFFQQYGMQCTPLHRVNSSKDALVELEGVLQKIAAGRKALRETWSGKVADTDLTLLEARLDAYLGEAKTRLAEATKRGADDDVRARFVRDYGVNTFEFFVFHATHPKAETLRGMASSPM